MNFDSKSPEDRGSLESALEAILISSSEPVTTEDMAKVLELPGKHILECLKALQDHYEVHHGFRLVRMGGGWQFASAPEEAVDAAVLPLPVGAWSASAGTDAGDGPDGPAPAESARKPRSRSATGASSGIPACSSARPTASRWKAGATFWTAGPMCRAARCGWRRRWPIFAAAPRVRATGR